MLLGAVGVAGGPPASAALHALGVGAVGTMILAVMCRTSLAHTGRPPIGGAGTTIACLALTLAAGLRVTAELMPDLYLPLLLAAGASWIAGFTLFVLIYAPILGSGEGGTPLAAIARGHAAQPVDVGHQQCCAIRLDAGAAQLGEAA